MHPAGQSYDQRRRRANMAPGHDTWYIDRVPIAGTAYLGVAWAGRHGRGDRLRNREGTGRAKGGSRHLISQILAIK
jgi:hypothetical protein